MAPKNLVAVGGGSKLEKVGFYFWYTVPEKMLRLSAVRKAFEDAGLDPDRLPTDRRPEHVAQEACRKVQRVVTNGRRIETRAEQVDRNPDFLIYQITRHVQDKENRVIEHPKALRVLFDFETSSLSYEPLDGSTREDVQPLIDEIQAHYDANSSKLSGSKLRTIIRHYVELAGAENMRDASGGVYFLTSSNAISSDNKLYMHHGAEIDGDEFLGAIEEVFDTLYPNEARFHKVGCINDEGEREYLKRKFVENCDQELKEYRDELLELVRTKGDRLRGFRADKISNLVAKRRAIDAKKAKFAEILGDQLDELDRNMKLADQALSKFLKEAEND